MSSSVTIVSVEPEKAGALRALLRDIARETSPESEAADRAVAGLEQARARYDFLRSDSFWILLAQVDGEPAGYAAACRIPKADARAGFLFVDEVHVLRGFRRRGVATALLGKVEALARELGLAGVRLLVRPENEAARRLYRSAGFEEHATVFCEKPVEV